MGATRFGERGVWVRNHNKREKLWKTLSASWRKPDTLMYLAQISRVNLSKTHNKRELWTEKKKGLNIQAKGIRWEPGRKENRKKKSKKREKNEKKTWNPLRWMQDRERKDEKKWVPEMGKKMNKGMDYKNRKKKKRLKFRENICIERM